MHSGIINALKLSTFSRMARSSTSCTSHGGVSSQCLSSPLAAICSSSGKCRRKVQNCPWISACAYMCGIWIWCWFCGSGSLEGHDVQHRTCSVYLYAEDIQVKTGIIFGPKTCRRYQTHQPVCTLVLARKQAISQRAGPR